MTKAFKQKRAADSFASKQRAKGYFASTFEEPVDPHASTRRARAVKRYYVQYDKGSSLMGNPSKRKTAKRKNAPKSRTLTLKGFTGKIRQLANGALTVKGRGRKK